MGRIRTAAIGGLVEDNPLAAAAVTLNSAGLSALPLFAAGDFALVMFDPNGRTGEPFAKRITAHGTNAVSATMDATAIYGTAREIKQGVPWRLTDILDQDGNGSGLISYSEYAGTGVDAYTQFTNTGSLADLDATNLKFDFITPPSGKVLIEIAGVAWQDGAQNNVNFGLREAAADIAGSTQLITYLTNNFAKFLYVQQVTGLTPGSAHTYKLAGFVNGGSGRLGHGPTRGKVTFKVSAVNT